MHTPGTFALFIQPGDEQTPSRVKVTIQRHADANGRVFIAPDCLSLDDLEGHITAGTEASPLCDTSRLSARYHAA